MSEYYFGIGSGLVRAKTCKRVGKILHKSGVDARIVCYDDPADGPHYWFSTSTPWGAARGVCLP